MKTFMTLLVLCTAASAQKMHVKVTEHTVDGVPFTRFVPGIGISNANANANCTGYGNTANCSANGTGRTIYAPAHTVNGEFEKISMMLLMPDGRRVEVDCEDHFGKYAQARMHRCKNPDAEEMDADFNGDKVKLTWTVGIDGRKKESDTFRVGHVYAALPATTKP